MPTKRKLRVFLCHASQDKPIVRDLYTKLTAEKWIDPWLDEERLLPGQDWDLEIEKAVEGSDAILVCLSSNSVSKEGYVQRELRKVITVSLEKPEGVVYIIPIRLDECEAPRSLRARQYIDYFPPRNRTAVYDKILASLKLRKDDLGI
jgi:hypothetical protein